MRTRIVIKELAKQYLKDEEYQEGFISKQWIDTVTSQLHLTELDDEELSNMWDMVFLTLQEEYLWNRIDENVKEAIKWDDVKSAFTEVVNIEARRRRA